MRHFGLVAAVALALLAGSSPASAAPLSETIIDISTFSEGPGEASFDRNFYASQGVVFTRGDFVNTAQGDRALGDGGVPSVLAGTFKNPVRSISVRVTYSFQGTWEDTLTAYDSRGRQVGRLVGTAIQDSGDPNSGPSGYVTRTLNVKRAASSFTLTTRFIRSSFGFQIENAGPSLGTLYFSKTHVLRRMVGRGSVSDGTRTAAYSYSLPCDAARDSDAYLEARSGPYKVRLTSIESASCVDNPPDNRPRKIHTGTGTVRLNGHPGWRLAWTLEDGGPDGAKDSVHFTLTSPSGISVFDGSAAPPGKFPGSNEPTGFNTAQAVSVP